MINSVRQDAQGDVEAIDKLTLVSRSCPLCGSSEDSIVFADANYDLSLLNDFAFASRKVPEYMHYRLVECLTCDLLYANPLPETRELSSAYEEAAFDSGDEALLASRTYSGLLKKLNLKNRSGALDIGTGDGSFLAELLKHGFQDVHGVEPSVAPIRAAEDSIKPLIENDIFRVESWEDDSLSLVTCFQTIEHVPEPLQMFNEIRQLLKPGGAVMIVCHDRRALSARMLGFKSPIFDIEHLQLFSEKSASRLLELAGYIDVTVHHFTNCYPLSYFVKLSPLPNAIKLPLLARLKNTLIGNAQVSLPLGNLVVIGYNR